MGLAELESLYGAEHVRRLGGAALLDIPAEEINFKRLGGTIKTARILARFPYSNWTSLTKYMETEIPKHLQHTPDGKFTFGLSAYGLKITPAEINHAALEIKKIIKKSGRSVRVVPNKSLELSSAQVLHNKLTHKGSWELLLIADGPRTILAQTLFVQDIEAYAARDQARPARDAKVGMLSPKLAQIIINLAVGQIGRWQMVDGRWAKTPTTNYELQTTMLDPFCGTGVVLQEALLMGYNVIGTDIDERMADYAKKNIQWLIKKYPEISGHVSMEIADATVYKWPRFTAVASEVYLGRPLSKLPDGTNLNKIIADTNTIIEKFLKNLISQLKPKQRICLALPAWRKPSGQLIHLPVVAKLTDMGYNIVKFKHVRSEDLIYFRENQIVARELLVLNKT